MLEVQWWIQGGEGLGGLPPPPPILLALFFLLKWNLFMSKKFALKEYQICLKMLEIAIIETQNNVKKFLGEHAPRPL